MGKIWAIVEGKIVVEGEHLPKLGETVYDSRMKEMGIVSSVLGKEARFFIEINPKENVKRKEGDPLYIFEESSTKR